MTPWQTVGYQYALKSTDSDYFPEASDVEFRLTYEGELKSNGRAPHKHEIRRVFHAQLKALWDMHPYLKTANASKETPGSKPRHFHEVHPSLRDYLAGQWSRMGYSTVSCIIFAPRSSSFEGAARERT